MLKTQSRKATITNFSSPEGEGFQPSPMGTLKEENYYRREMAYGTFQRSFALPDGVDADNIKADYSDGVIKITIPKPETKQPQKITVH